MEDYPGILPGNSGIQESYQEIQDFPGILAGISGIQDDWQEIQDFSGSQTLGITRFNNNANVNLHLTNENYSEEPGYRSIFFMHMHGRSTVQAVNTNILNIHSLTEILSF